MKLKAFLFVLIRDYLAAGTCDALLRDAEKAHKMGASFDNAHLTAYVDEAAAKLSNDAELAEGVKKIYRLASECVIQIDDGEALLTRRKVAEIREIAGLLWRLRGER
jgi:hypothetical protein